MSDETRSFARDVGRELTPPLTTLWNRIEVMLAELRSDQPPADIRGDLETLRRHAAQMAVTVKGLQCVSGEHVFEPHPVDLNVLVEDSLSPVVSRLARQHIEVKFLCDRTIPPVLGDGDALRYALTTVVETAAETLKTVNVTTRSAEDGEVRISVGTGRASQAVRGITPQDGLRLGLADAIVRSLGGRIERRDGNPGATFLISLRAVSESRPASGMSA